MHNLNLIGISGKENCGKKTVAKLIMLHKGYDMNDKDNKIFKITPANIDSLGLEFKSGFKMKQFSDNLKRIISILTGISILGLEKAVVENSKIGEEWSYLLWYNMKNTFRVNPNRWKDYDPNRIKNYTVNQILKYVGTDLLKNQLHEDVWVNSLFADYKDGYHCGGNIIVSKEEFINQEPVKNNKNHSVEELLKKNKFSDKWIITDVCFPNEAEAIKKRGGILIRVNNPDYVPYPEEHKSETELDSYNGFDFMINNKKGNGLGILSEAVKTMLNTISFKPKTNTEYPSFWFMRDNQTFTKPVGKNIKEITKSLTEIAKENPYGMVTKVTILKDEEELRRVGVNCHVSANGDVDLTKWLEEVMKEDCIHNYKGEI